MTPLRLRTARPRLLPSFERLRRTRWPRGRPRVLVADSWLANAGDGAISIATHRRIRDVAPRAAVLHAAYQSDLVGRHYPGLDFVPPLAGLLGVVSDLPEARGWKAEDLTAVVRQADVVLSQGGGFLIEHYRPWQRLDAYERVVDLGVPLGFVAQTIGSFEREDKRASLSRALQSAVVVGVRDHRSVENVVALGLPRSRVRLAADEAFSLFPVAPPPADRQGVAIVLSGHALTGESGYVQDEPKLRRALSETVQRVAEVIDPEQLTLLSTTQGLGSLDRKLEDDALLAQEVAADLPPILRARVRRVSGYLPPLRCANLIARHRAVISMRMHPVIFALSQGVPAVAITKAHKALDLLSHLEMDDIVPSWLEPREIADALARALDPDAPRGAELWARLEPARRRASLNRELLAELFAVTRRS